MTHSSQPAPRRIEWTVALFLVLNPLAALIGLWFCYDQGVIGNPGIWLLALFGFTAASMSITGGYHRLLAHRSYEAHPIVETIFLFFGASAFEGSALKWASDHRRHHGEVDTDGDPYSIQKGFWYAHIGWLFFKESADLPIERVADLQRNPRVMFQHKYYIPIAIFMGYLLPMIMGAFMGSALAGLFIAGALRIVANQHTTFFVNSLCHMVGKQTYSLKVSARDSFLIALLTYGEGYHNFHHTFQLDFRNGIKWYQWDPTKWIIHTLSWMGLARKLRTISAAEILKARLQMESLHLKSQGFSHEKVEQMKHKVLEAQARWRQMKEDYAAMKRQARAAGEAHIRSLKWELRMAKLEFRSALAQWRISMRAGAVLVKA
jgi:stearoyl-CoA desaturase (delta-9 desaturase)